MKFYTNIELIKERHIVSEYRNIIFKRPIRDFLLLKLSLFYKFQKPRKVSKYTVLQLLKFYSHTQYKV